MVKTFQAYLPVCHRTYSCIHCRAHLANHDELISKVCIHSSIHSYIQSIIHSIQSSNYIFYCILYCILYCVLHFFLSFSHFKEVRAGLISSILCKFYSQFSFHSIYRLINFSLIF